MKSKGPTKFEEYAAEFPAGVRKLLMQMRATIRKAAPGAEEKIGYGMPAFALEGRPLVYFAAMKEHVGFYPTASGIAEFKAVFEKAGLEYSKGAVKFPMDRPLPLALVTRITKFRVKENLARAGGKKKVRARPAARKISR